MTGESVEGRARLVVLAEQVRAAVEPLRAAFGAAWPLHLDPELREEVAAVAAVGVRLATEAASIDRDVVEDLAVVFASVFADVEACR